MKQILLAVLDSFRKEYEHCIILVAVSSYQLT